LPSVGNGPASATVHQRDPAHGPRTQRQLAWSDKWRKVPTLGAYVAAWDNPRPQPQNSRIDFALDQKGVAILIASTGYWDADEHGWK